MKSNTLLRYPFTPTRQPTIGPPSFMPIDVEGAKPEVVRGGIETTKKHRPSIISDRIEKIVAYIASSNLATQQDGRRKQ